MIGKRSARANWAIGLSGEPLSWLNCKALFQPVYQYVMRNGRPEGEPIPSEVWAERGVVYARIFKEAPVYIGSTDRRCAGRVLNHIAGIGKSIKPVGIAYREWAEGKQITIVAYKPPDMEFLGRMIPTHRAIEAALIEMFRPIPIGSRPWFVARA